MNPHCLPYRLLWRTPLTEWKTQRNAPKKTWMKHIEEDLAKHRLNLTEAKEQAPNKQQWRIITQCCQWQRSIYSNVFATWSPTTRSALGHFIQSIIASIFQSSDIRVQTTCFFTKEFFKLTSTRSHTLIINS